MLLVFLATGGSVAAPHTASQSAPSAGPTTATEKAAARASPPDRAASPTPAGTPRYRLIPYGFETVQSRSTVPLLRFEDRSEVRSLEMNQAIARFFNSGDGAGDMLRGAAPFGPPTIQEMAGYRPHATAGINLVGVAGLAAREIKKRISNRKGMPAAEASPSPAPTP